MENEKDVSVVVLLADHCIETEARRALKAIQTRLLEDDVPEDEKTLVAKMQLLEEFLTSRDFRRLRASDPELAGGHDVRVRLFRTGRGVVEFEKLGSLVDDRDG